MIAYYDLNHDAKIATTSTNIDYYGDTASTVVVFYEVSSIDSFGYESLKSEFDNFMEMLRQQKINFWSWIRSHYQLVFKIWKPELNYGLVPQISFPMRLMFHNSGVRPYRVRILCIRKKILKILKGLNV